MPRMDLTHLYPFCFHVMGYREAEKSSLSGDINNMPISGVLRQKHNEDLERLTLASRPLKTLKFFVLAIVLYIKRSVIYLRGKAGLLIIFSIPTLILGCFLSTMRGPHHKHVHEFLEYFRYGLWWMSLGVASSIGLGSGLHTFVLYLGPHIALFTIKAMQCGRVDIKRAPYDTIQLERGPSWLEKDCSEYGPPSFNLSSSSSHIPLSSILPQVQTEAILWGIGTALGELPPYFISRAAHTSGSEQSPVGELDEGDGRLKRMKYWLLSHAQYLNFFTILLLASVPNPLFDLAGIMCGQFGIPFWEFFLATFVGKAIIKTHIQTVFIISICNNQLLDWIEDKLIIGVVGLVPGMTSVLPGVVTSLHAVREKYMAASRHPVPTHIKVSRWDFSFASVWNTVVLLMLTNFFVKIVNATAQRHLRKQQEMEMDDDDVGACPVATCQSNDI